MLIRSIFFVLLMWSSLVALAGPSPVATALLPNVVSVSATINNTTGKGFAIIVGESSDKYYFATADHVVRGRSPRDRTQEISVQFYQAEALKFVAELHSVSDRKTDVAFITVRKHQNGMQLAADQNRPPLVLFRWDAMGGVENDQVGQPVSSIGANANWQFVSGTADVESQATPFYFVRNLEVDKGSSGSPLLDKNGIIGLLSERDVDTTKVISLAHIKAVAERYGIPWNLTERRTETDLSGRWLTQEKWADDTDFNGSTMIDIQRLDLVRFKVTAPETGTQGYGILDGNRVRVWWQSDLWGDEFGEFTIHRDGSNSVSLTGRAADEESDEEYLIRVTRLNIKSHPASSTSGPQGCWNIAGLGSMVVNPDNTTVSGPFRGRLSVRSNTQYDILWDRFVDALQLSDDGHALQGGNNYGWPVLSQRVSGSANSVVGDWNWGGTVATFKPDGTLLMHNIIAGRWIKTAQGFEIHWLSRLGYFINLAPGASSFSGSMAIRFETTQPVPDIIINTINGQRC